MTKALNKLLKSLSKVSKAEGSEAINQIMDGLNKNLDDVPQERNKPYELILKYLKESNERLWFTTCMGLGKNLMEQGGAENF
jgi:hypothetical protein